jgi:hypothetical protein
LSGRIKRNSRSDGILRCLMSGGGFFVVDSNWSICLGRREGK